MIAHGRKCMLVRFLDLSYKCLIKGRSGSWKPRVLRTVVGNILALAVFSLVASLILMRGQVSQAVEMVLMGATDYLARRSR